MPKKKKKIPIYSNTVSAGFPSPADDYIESALDLNEHLIHKPAATFFVRVKGDSMIGAGIHEGDLLIVDRSLEAGHKSIVLAILNGEFLIKRLIKKGKIIFLYAENPKYKPIEVKEGFEFQIFGVIKYCIHSVV